MLHGMLLSKLQSRQRHAPVPNNWLFIPIEDPDGNVDCTFDSLTDKFTLPYDEKTPREVFDYAKYLIAYIESGQSIDIAMSLHNVEANEGSNFFCPFVDAQYAKTILPLNKELLQRLNDGGFRIGPDRVWQSGWMPFRLYGWCSARFGSLPLTFEANDRYPQNRLTLLQIQHLGRISADFIEQWCLTEPGKTWHLQVRKRLAVRTQQRNAYWKTVGYGPESRSKYDILTLGY